jgi:4-amino-4-deoxy-L-arabinose transferase-like glycosyltransferase
MIGTPVILKNGQGITLRIFRERPDAMKKSRGKGPAPKTPSPAFRIAFVEVNVHVLLPAILFSALLVRVIALAGFSRSIYGDFLLWDERVYQSWASHILQGKSFVVHDFSPLPAYVMAAVYGLFTGDPVSVRSLNILFGVVTCLFIYLIARDLANRTTGLLACLMAALYKPFIFLNVTLLKESLGLFLFSATIYFFVSLMKDSPSPTDEAPRTPNKQRREFNKGGLFYGKILFLGITAGLLINVRQNSVVLLPVFLFFLLWHVYKKTLPLHRIALTTAVYLIGLSIAIVPFLVRNHQATGDFAAAPAGGFNLYLANNLDNPYPYYRPVPFATSIPSEQAVQFIIEAGRRTGNKLSPREASKFWTWETVRIIKEHPAAFTSKIGQKTLALLHRSEAEDNYDIGFISRFIPFFRLPFLAFWFVFPMGMTALILSRRKTDIALALNAVAIVYALTLVAFFTNMRIRIPLMVILIPYAAIGLRTLLTAVKQKAPFREIRPFLIVLSIFAVVEFMPMKGAGDLSGHYNTHAINLASKGLKREAIQYWQESSAMERPYSAYANLSLAALGYGDGDYKKGDSYIEKIPDDSFAAAAKYELMGDAWLKQGQSDQAILAYEKSLRINSGLIAPRSKLVRLYETRDPRKARMERERLEYIESFYREAGRL